MRGSAVLADIVIGAHGTLSLWVFEVVNRIAALAPGRSVRKFDRMDVIEFLAAPRPIILTHYPSKQLIDAIEHGDARVLFVEEQPLELVRYLQAALGLSPIEAIRSQTASAVANLAIGRAETVHYVTRGSERTVGTIVRDIARMLDIALTDQELRAILHTVSGGLGADADLERVLSNVGDRYCPPDRVPAAAGSDLVTASADDVVAPLLAMARGHTSRPVVWPTFVFKHTSQPNAPAPRTAEVAGPARNLYYGPYLHLPPARYRVESILEFSEETKDVPFVIELHGSSWLSQALIPQRKAGHYRGYFELVHNDPIATVEIRLRSIREISRGTLSLIELLFFVTGEV